MADLVERSREIILQNQDASGAFIACPTFQNYRYAWFRDGAFTANAMDRVGERASAARFFDWAADVINARGTVVLRAVEKAGRGEALDRRDILHTRYTIAGEESTSDWPNFQLDGFGTLLWAMEEHIARWQCPLPKSWLDASSLVSQYLQALWHYPCFDCWEEFPEKIHTHTLAAIHAGLTASQEMGIEDMHGVADEISDFINQKLILGNHFVKYHGSAVVDASLLGLAVPYHLCAVDDPRFEATIVQIESSLRNGGGLHRYAADTYYGGGEWVLLAGWLGWYYALHGDLDRAHIAQAWIEDQADEYGQLPEQVPGTLNDPAMYQPWVDRWGEIARPLLWSHAMYLILHQALHHNTGSSPQA
jgi:GH15 family glucan-1,4-alpha-glucosidase